MSDGWSKLNGQSSEEDAAVTLARRSTELLTFLEADPQAEQQFLEIIHKRLGSKINEETLKDLAIGLEKYLGQNLADLVIWVLMPNQQSKIQELEKHASPKVAAFFRRVLGLYGPELEKAFNQVERYPDEWSFIYREVYFNKLSQQHLIRLRIEKYNNEEVLIEGNADSILSLVSHIIWALHLVGNRDAFSEESLSLFDSNAMPFIELIRSPTEKAEVIPEPAES